MTVLRERASRVWLVLVVLTVLTTWGLSKDLLAPSVAVAGTFLVVAIKVRLVMLDFMELRHAPVRVRIVFESWIVVIVLAILGLWFLTPVVNPSVV
ncbi:cytochrome C oxidase subunit IV family protein [Mycolicibacterium sp. jd]|uniref:cytochrome C oxidase subunit IV family protein n=1 Tax=Mycobacteriaceae TaxID=1762 RepID=UPI0021B4BB02|nr:cytochrome C oxidase subunit IV family protein [Mycobacterium sp. SMC-8]UXA13916.1 cytochrome C oxidase subunit IV family protein [Mycobacterium sp. SMC-8]